MVNAQDLRLVEVFVEFVGQGSRRGLIVAEGLFRRLYVAISA
jgi:hypothetical protein